MSPKDNKFSVLAKLDEKVHVKVNTAVGETDEFELTEVVLQGTVSAPLKCTVQFETLSKDVWSCDNGDALYVYKDCVYPPVTNGR